jgi:hypothetical protein
MRDGRGAQPDESKGRPMYADEHAGHTTCAAPGCAIFHLFCPDCGGRRHLIDELPPSMPVVSSATHGGPEQAAMALDGDRVVRRDEYRLAGFQN